MTTGQLGAQTGRGHHRARTWSMPATSTQLAALRQELGAWLDAAGVAASTRDGLVLATHEVVANAVEHAYRDDPIGLVWVRADADPAGGVRIEVRDAGRWRAAHSAGDRGRGLRLAAALVTTLEVRRGGAAGGTTVVLRASPCRTDGGDGSTGWAREVSNL